MKLIIIFFLLMMFLRRKVIFCFKIASILFVCFILSVMMHILFANEKINSEIKKFAVEETRVKPDYIQIWSENAPKYFKFDKRELVEYSNKCFVHTDQKFDIFVNLPPDQIYPTGKESYSPSEKSCYAQYLAYYMYAIILGAYINIKRLYKMGPI